jgi:hypothetical protein
MPDPSPHPHRVNKLDLAFGVAIPGVILGPMLLLGLLGMVVTGSKGDLPNESKDVMGILVAMSLAGLLALAAVAAAVFIGPERIKRNAVLRGAVVLGLLAGVAVAGYALWAQRSSVAWSAGANAGALFVIVPGLLALGGPIVVALRYLPALLRR